MKTFRESYDIISVSSVQRSVFEESVVIWSQNRFSPRLKECCRFSCDIAVHVSGHELEPINGLILKWMFTNKFSVPYDTIFTSINEVFKFYTKTKASCFETMMMSYDTGYVLLFPNTKYAVCYHEKLLYMLLVADRTQSAVILWDKCWPFVSHDHMTSCFSKKWFHYLLERMNSFDHTCCSN